MTKSRPWPARSPARAFAPASRSRPTSTSVRSGPLSCQHRAQRAYRLERYGERTLGLFQRLVRHCLACRMTSPEAERLLRRVLVHAIRQQLIQRSRAHTAPPNVQVARLSGVHRNFVARILTEPPCKAPAPRGGARGRRL